MAWAGICVQQFAVRNPKPVYRFPTKLPEVEHTDYGLLNTGISGRCVSAK